MTTTPSIQDLHDKYFKMADSVGIDEAITRLHNDMGQLEPHVFDGGYDKGKFRHLQHLRDLARDLYNYKLEQASKEYRS